MQIRSESNSNPIPSGSELAIIVISDRIENVVRQSDRITITEFETIENNSVFFTVFSSSIINGVTTYNKGSLDI